MLTSEQRQRCNLEHAHWRVEFLLSLLDSHRTLPTAHDERWRVKEADYVRRLAKAQVELERLERLEGLAMSA